MKLVVCAPQDLKEELPSGDEIAHCSREEANDIVADVLLYLYDDGLKTKFSGAKNVIINCVNETTPADQNILRMNGWKGFIARDTWEICGDVNNDVSSALQLLNKKWIICRNEPGFISARVLAMIINEAWFAKESDISSEQEIDTAMKLGTGYPFGPFEWGRKIGLNNVVSLLNILSEEDKRYQPSDMLLKAAE